MKKLSIILLLVMVSACAHLGGAVEGIRIFMQSAQDIQAAACHPGPAGEPALIDQACAFMSAEECAKYRGYCMAGDLARPLAKNLARAINQAVVADLPELLQACQLVHISGQLDAEWVRQASAELPGHLRVRHHPTAYMHEELAAAMAAADLVVARAGAATLAEFPAVGLPSVLVP